MTSPLVLSFALALQLASAAEPLPVKRLDGAPISPAEIDATVARLLRAGEVTGAGIAIFNGGKIVHRKAYGFRDTEKKLPLTENSVMGAASLTKPTFGRLVLQLVDEQVLDLDRPIQDYLPKPLPEYDAYRDLAGDPRYRKLTARMLLSHTSGFPNFRWLNPDHKLNINFEPGSRYAYSGEGIQLLQLVVETVTKTPLQNLMQRRIFGPLEMSRTSMVSEPRFEDDYANGYDEYGRSLGHQDRKSAQAAGSMQTTLRDFSTFLQAVIEGKGLTRRTHEAMLSPQIRIASRRQFPTLSAETTTANDAIRLSYGLGWGLYWTPYGKAFFKEGHDEGFRNYAVIFEKSGDGILILTNSSNGEGIFKGLLEELLRNPYTPIAWEGFTPYTELPPRKPLPVHHEITLAPELLDRLTGKYAFSTDLVLTVTRDGGRLLLRENSEAPGALYPESELRFFSKTADDVVTFELDRDGRVVRLVIHTGGRSLPVDRAR